MKIPPSCRIWFYFICLFAFLTMGCIEAPGKWVVNSDIWGSSPDDVYLSGYVSGCSCEQGGFVKHWDGEQWTVVYESDLRMWSIWGAPSGELFVNASSSIIRFGDGQWTILSADSDRSPFSDIHGTAADNVFSVGQDGLIAHYDGLTFTEMESGTSVGLQGVWVTSTTEAFAVGEQGKILRYDGDTWSPMDSGTTRELNDIWGASSTDIYAVGGSETEVGYIILHYNGATWSTIEEGEPFHLAGVWGSSSDNIYAVGGARKGDDSVDDAILHYDGQNWTRLSSKANQFLWNVWTSSPGSYFVVGPDDTKIKVTL